MIRLVVPALTVMLMVAAFVGISGWNRSSEPRLTLALTERELPLVWRQAPAPDDTPGLQLRIAVQHRHDPLDARNWLPESRLRALGFDLDLPAGAPTAFQVYGHVPPRRAWIVFEYDGPAWREIERRRALQPAAVPRLQALASRLVPVDAGLDFDTLARRYAAGHLILPGVIGLTYVPAAAGGPFVHGVLREVVPGTLAVPSVLRGVFDDLPPRAESSTEVPRYEAEIAIGSLGLPYLRSAARLRP